LSEKVDIEANEYGEGKATLRNPRLLTPALGTPYFHSTGQIAQQALRAPVQERNERTT
jgi:hypothetical protein